MCKHPIDLDLKGVDTVAIDIETYDPNLKTKGLGAVRQDGFITGVAVATGKDTVYFSLKHSDDDKSEEELKEFFENLSQDQFSKIRKFFDTMPKLRHTTKVKNPKTGVESTITFSGLQDFFGLASPTTA